MPHLLEGAMGIQTRFVSGSVTSLQARTLGESLLAQHCEWSLQHCGLGMRGESRWEPVFAVESGLHHPDTWCCECCIRTLNGLQVAGTDSKRIVDQVR